MRMRILLLVVVSICGCSLLAQADLQQRYPFLKLEANVLQFPAGQEKMSAFFDRLEELSFSGKGQLNVLHIGGSHVQAGTLSSAMRQGMQQLHPGIAGSRGFFFPHALGGHQSTFEFFGSSQRAVGGFSLFGLFTQRTMGSGRYRSRDQRCRCADRHHRL